MSKKEDKLLEEYPDSPRLIDVSEICKNPNFGELNFEIVEKRLKEMKDVIIEFEDFDYRSNLRSTQHVATINNVRKEVLEFLNSITTFNLKEPNSPARRDQIINQVNSYYDRSFFHQIEIPLLQIRQETQLAKVDSKDLAKKVADFNKSIEEVQSVKENLQKEIDALKAEKEKLDQQKEEVESGELALGTSSLSRDFQDQFEFHGEEAKKWLKYTIAFFVLFVVLLLSFSYTFPYDSINLTNPSFYLGLFFEIIVLSTVFYGLNFCRKNYNIERNLELRNRSKRTFAETLDRFLASKSDIEFKKDMLRKAAPSMFKLEITGYLEKDTTNLNPTHEIISNVVKSQLPSGK